MNHTLVYVVAVGIAASGGALPADERVTFFEQVIRPALVEHCYSCHSQTARDKGVLKGELRLDSRAGLLRGGVSGPAIVPGKPTASLLVAAVRHQSLEMPPTGKLDAGLIRAIERWVADGAVFPSESPAATSTHWSLLPVRDPMVPQPAESNWPVTDIDRFILARLQQRQLTPASAASRATLLRRVTFDLIGLPPTRADIESFVQDQDANAWEQVIDRLLESRHYGERWGRHWLDVVRYADTTANDGNFVMRYAWRYRDYVIEAFNRDLPYDQFILEQVAGDRLDPTAGARQVLRRHLATGFLMLGPKGLAETDKEQLKMDIVDEQIDVTTRAFLGMSFSCARCHDHKFDPIPTKDYYALAGIFRGLVMLNGQSGPTSMWHEGKLASGDDSQETGRAGLQAELRSQRDKISTALETVDARQTEWEIKLRETWQPVTAELDALHNPAELAGLRAWYSADSLDLEEGAKVTVWHNKQDTGGPNQHGLALRGLADSAPRFRVSSINGQPAVAFKSSQHFLKTPSMIDFAGAHPYTIYLVVTPLATTVKRHQAVLFGNPQQAGAGMIWEIDSVDTPYPRLDLASGHSFDATAGKVELGTPQIWSARYAGSKLVNAAVRVSGTLQDLKIHAGAANHQHRFQSGALILGGDTTAACLMANGPTMNVAELLLFDRAVSPQEETQVGAWLQTKYQLPGAYPNQLRVVLHKPRAARTASEKKYLRSLFLRTQDAGFRQLVRQHDALQNKIAQVGATAEYLPAMFAKESGGRDLQVHRRGNRKMLGPLAPRQTPSLFPGIPPIPIDTASSGRLPLARWIASAANRLTARVLVNRVWQHHFGTGLVASSDNFGRIGTRPSHPHLLDYLAKRFVEDGWSIKSLHKRILLSRVYQQTSLINPENVQQALELDPENRLLWKYPRRRLEAEMIRDSLLSASGTLNTDYLGGGELVMRLYDAGETVDRDLGLASVANQYQIAAFASPRRSVYLPVIRNAQNEIMAVFDAADANAVTTRRTESVVPTQTSFLLNSPFVASLAQQFAQRLLKAENRDDAARIQQGYWIALGRAASPAEANDASRFIDTYLNETLAAGVAAADARLAAWTSFCQFLFCLNEFVYVD